MAKTNITDYSTTPSANTDIGGVGISDSNSAKNIRDGMQQEMSALARMNAGTAPLDDTFTVRDPDDTSKTARLDCGNLSTSTAAVLDASALNRNGAPIVTKYKTAGTFTHTFNAASRSFRLTGAAGGGGGGGVDGQGAGKDAAASGGGSGFHGFTDDFAIGSITTGTVVVGAGGSGGSGLAGANGANGGDTTWSDGVNTVTMGGGKGGNGIVADAGTAGLAGPPGRASFSNVYGTSDRRTIGYIANAHGYGGIGGSSGFGTGGAGGDNSTGTDGAGYGAGGGGAAVTDTATNYAGGAGTGGILIVEEW